MSETTNTKENKRSRAIYWLATLVSLVATIALLIFASEWFWLGLPFVLTSAVLAFDVI